MLRFQILSSLNIRKELLDELISLTYLGQCSLLNMVEFGLTVLYIVQVVMMIYLRSRCLYIKIGSSIGSKLVYVQTGSCQPGKEILSLGQHWIWYWNIGGTIIMPSIISSIICFSTWQQKDTMTNGFQCQGTVTSHPISYSSKCIVHTPKSALSKSVVAPIFIN